ncbi:hypothetical protein AB0870_05065 [Microbacterium proteolyticum]|uniref:hypothetical protein n=1 Tax=Microbacterium proteolyticum TaxID=1572644 RepID=UPI0024161D28|nr:hypothetical protein [Microbacterium proteolyticum]
MNDELTPDERAAMRARIVGGARDIAPVGAHRNAWIAGSVAAVLVAAIAGGVVAASTLSAPQIANTPSPSATATVAPVDPTPTPTPTPTLQRTVTSPTSRFSFDCGDVAPRVAEIFGGTVPEVASTIPRRRGNLWQPGPMEYSFAQAGALYCEFGDLLGTSATIALVPEAEGAIEDQARVIGCDGAQACELVDGTYVLVEVTLSESDQNASNVTSIVDDVRAALGAEVLAAPPSASLWEPPTGTTPLTGDCATILPAQRLTEILGLADVRVASELEGGWSLQSWMLYGYWDAPFCEFRGLDADQSERGFAGQLMWLPGGEWAYDVAITGAVVDAPGGRSTDRVRLSGESLSEFQDLGETFFVDVLVDGNWVRYQLLDTVEEAARPAIAARIAETIFEQVYR